jgi:hypothetical protein
MYSIFILYTIEKSVHMLRNQWCYSTCQIRRQRKGVPSGMSVHLIPNLARGTPTSTQNRNVLPLVSQWAHTPLSCQPLAFNFMQWNLKKAKKLNSVSLFALSIKHGVTIYITTWTTKALSLSLSLVVWASMLSCPRSSVVTHMENTVSLVQVYTT